MDLAHSGRRAHVENKPTTPLASEGHNQRRSTPHALSHRTLVPPLCLGV